MSTKEYHKSEIQICGNCKGEGQVWKQTEPARHGSSDYEIGHFITCSTCTGSGIVKVTRDITITIEPHILKLKQQ